MRSLLLVSIFMATANAQRFCCMAMTPACLACSAGMTVQAYCAANPNAMGCASVVGPGTGIITVAPQCPAAAPTPNSECPRSGPASCSYNPSCCAGSTNCINTTQASCVGGSWMIAMVARQPCPSPSSPSIGQPCCRMAHPRCWACMAGQTIDEYCQANPTRSGCGAVITSMAPPPPPAPACYYTRSGEPAVEEADADASDRPADGLLASTVASISSNILTTVRPVTLPGTITRPVTTRPVQTTTTSSYKDWHTLLNSIPTLQTTPGDIFSPACPEGANLPIPSWWLSSPENMKYGWWSARYNREARL